MRRAAGLVVGVVLVWSAQDAVIWRIWFDGRPWSPSADLYQFWHQAFLVGLVVGGLLFLRRGWALWFAASTWVLANGGLPDVLYYWLALKRIPLTLPWLDQTHPLVIFHPATSTSVVASSLIWVAVVIGIALLAKQKDLMEELIDRQRGRVRVGGSL